MTKKQSPSVGPEPVTVAHILNSLAQIEIWVRAIRAALANLEPETQLKVSTKVAEEWSGSVAPLITGKWCPPPD